LACLKKSEQEIPLRESIHIAGARVG